MKKFSIALCALLASTCGVGCAASSESPSDPAPNTQLGTEKVATTPVVFPLWDYNNNRLYIATCPLSMPMPNNIDEAHERAECGEVTPAKIELVNVLIQNAAGKVVGDAIVEDRPGGGCVHVDIASPPSGGSFRIVALVKDVPGAGHAMTVDFTSLGIVGAP
jgi:hypothetical protein